LNKNEKVPASSDIDLMRQAPIRKYNIPGFILVTIFGKIEI
jgi:hypothetical protein